MAAGAAPAPEKKADTTTESTETNNPQPVTLLQRALNLLHEIFKGREEHLGWHQ
ncbi:MAG: hypothetical protein ABSA27_13475 [Terriglobales bacterium]|jgi:hypothetical protein